MEVKYFTSTSKKPSKYYGFESFSGSGSEIAIEFVKLSRYLILLSKHCKIGGAFITIPTNGCSDIFHDSKGCLVRQ